MRSPSLHVVPQDHFFGDALASDVAIRNYLEPIRKHLTKSGATELCINRPGEVILEIGSKKEVILEPSLTFEALESFAQAIAVYAQQTIGPSQPLLSATLPDGERVQIVMPPAVEPGFISMTIRIPGSEIIPLSKYASAGAFDKFLWPRPTEISTALEQLESEDKALAFMLSVGRLDFFIDAAIKACKNIAVVGDTGSGKTTLMKSMCQSIPLDERLITIEDVRELSLPMHFDCVHLLYSKNGQSVAKVGPGDLIASCMRMKPDRVLLAELRSAEAWDFLKLLTAGHSGSITSYHAESCSLAFERFMFMAKENMEAASLTRDELKNIIRLTLDVVIHVKRETLHDEQGNPCGVLRYVDEIYFDPWAKQEARFGGKVTNVPTVHFTEDAKDAS